MSKRVLIGVAISILCGGVDPGWAQEPPGRPFRGLFGADLNLARTKILDFTGAVSTAYDDTLPNFRSGQQWVRQPGFITEGRARLTFERRGERVDFGALGESSMQHYPRLGNFVALNHAAEVALSAQVARRTRIQLSQGLEYSPHHRFRVFPVAATNSLTSLQAATGDFAVLGSETYGWHSNVSLTQQLGQFSSVALSYERQQLDFVAADLDWTRQQIGGLFRRQVAPNITLRAGYAYLYREHGRLRPATQNHHIDTGLEYSRSLSLSRRAVLSFGTGTSVTSRTRSGDETQNQRYFFRLLGDAALNYEIGRSWVAFINYERGLQFIEANAEPFFSDTVTGGINGYVNPRAHFSASVGYSTGGLRFSTRGRGYDTYTARSRLRVGVTTNIALDAEYFYYHYLFDSGVTIPSGFPNTLDRQLARVGMTFWVPLLQ